MDQAVKATILDILSKQTDMTIATVREDHYPQATTVSYVNDGLDAITESSEYRPP
jgi:nitroimidazol reductase NimA-like FMN-containing flavoprotein (pyridoxamine 5'-phosphate oxidase superfamily)